MHSRSASLPSSEELSSADSVHSQPCFLTQPCRQHLDPAVQERSQEFLLESLTSLSGSAHTTVNAPPPCAPSVGRLPSPHTRHGVAYGLSKQPGPPACTSTTASSSDWVRLNVGGRIFVTTLSTLCADPNTVLAQLFAPLQARLLAEAPPPIASATNERAGAPTEASRPALSTSACPPHDEAGGGGEQLNPQPEELLVPLDLDAHDGILLDLDPDYFAPVLNYLRHRVVMVPPQLSPQGLLAVAEYLNVRGMVRQLRPVRRIRRQLLFSWGSGTNGELGTQSLEDSETPTMVRVAPFGVRVTHVALGANYSCVLSEHGHIYAFGNGDWGQLGLGGAMNLDVHPCDKSAVVLVPRRIPLFERHRAVHLSAGYAFAIAVVEGHHVYFWGNNNHGQSGLGPDYFNLNFKKIDEPKLVEFLEGKRVVQVGCGSFFTIALTEDGRLYSWGLIECLGLGPPEAVKLRYANTPILGESLSNEKRGVLLTPQEVQIETAHPIVRLHAGQWHSGVINAAGELFTWGVGYQGRLGHGTRDPAYVPTRVRGALEGHRVVEVACGSFHTVARTDRGAVFCWGDNASGQCGTNALNTEAVVSPYQVVRLEYVAGGVARGVSCGRQHTLVVMEGPQPGCNQRCCRFEIAGRSRPSHAQVYTFGDTPRSGNGSGVFGGTASSGPAGFPFRTPNSLPGAPTASAMPLRPPAIRGQSGSNTNANNSNNHNITANNNSGVRAGAGAVENTVLLDYSNGTPVSASLLGAPHRGCSLYRLMPGLEQMNVRGIVSGLYHTFVFAEELELSEEPLYGETKGTNGC